MAITASEARARLFPLIQQVNDDRAAVEVVSKRGNVFIVSQAEYESLQETAYLLRSLPTLTIFLRALLKPGVERSRSTTRPGAVRLIFTRRAWGDYQHWLTSDRAVLKRLNRLIEDAAGEPMSGIGKPERLNGRLAGAWSRRITEEHRLVYTIEGDDLVILASRHHYDER